MSSPESNEDPYVALGVSKDADTSAIRSAYRKLALKYHPDRIRDEALQEKGKDEFQKIQRAYEILSDPQERSRYDDRIKLAQLRKEAAARQPPPPQPPVRTASYPIRTAAMPTPSREYRDGKFYEERTPNNSYFEEYRYREEEPRTTSRKYDGYERKASTGNPEKERKSTSKWPEKSASGLPFNIATKLKVKATKTRETVRARESTKEAYAANAKARDREQTRDRFEKQNSRAAFVADVSDSDSDTATQVTAKPKYVSSSKQSYPASPPRPKSNRESMGKKGSSGRYDDEDDGDDGEEDKWHGYHENAAEYIQRSQVRPTPPRVDSSSSYWGGADERSSGRRSGSDSDKRPRSSKGRRPSIDVPKVRPPTMPSHSSAPSGVNAMRSQLDRHDRTPVRSSSGGKSSRDHRKEMPQMSRSQTMPSVKASRKADAAPIRGSNLKHAESYREDSGYGSSGGHTPEMHGSSSPKFSSTRYTIVEPDDDYGIPQFLPSEERYRMSRSPSPPPRERDRRERPTRPTISVDARPRQSRGATYSHSPVEMDSPRQAAFRHESSRSTPRGGSPRDSPPISRHNSGRGAKLFGEVDDRESYSYRMPPESVIMTPRFDKQKVKYAQYERRSSFDNTDREFFPNSHREQTRPPRMETRRGSVY